MNALRQFSNKPLSGRSIRPKSLVVRASEAPQPGAAPKDEEAAFEARIRALREAKGQTPRGEGKKAGKDKVTQLGSTTTYDFSGEQLHFEGPPAVGDLVTNLALMATIVWLPLTIGAIGRFAFLKYRFTDRRLSIITAAPWQNETLDVPYQEIANIVSVPRGIGLWGDMAITLKNGTKAEVRALDNFRELQAYMLQRRDDLLAAGSKGGEKQAAGAGPKGFAA